MKFHKSLQSQHYHQIFPIEVEGEGMRDLTWVVIEEVKPGDWAIGGKLIISKAKS